MAEEAIKAYKIPIKDPPKDLIEAYFIVKEKLLKEVMKCVKYSSKGKAHLHLKAEERRKLRNELLKDWKYSKHYIDSAINSVIGLVKGWIKLYNRGKAKTEPRVTRKSVYIKNTLFSYQNGILKISIKPRRQYLVIDLRRYSWIPEDFDKIGGLILTERELIIPLKKRVEPRAEVWSSFDVNLTNITALINGRIVRYDLRLLYHIHRVYEEKRRRLQRLAKHKPKTARRLLKKYSRRERDRAVDFTHKLTARIAGELANLKSGAILEDLKDIKSRTLHGSKNHNRKLSKWNARMFQFMLEYKLKWLSLPVKCINPRNTSRICPVCQAPMAAYRGRLIRCLKCGTILDRDVVAVLNLQMRGAGVPPRVLLGALAPMMGKQLVDQKSINDKCLPAVNP